MKLYDLCQKITATEEALRTGEIPLPYDKLIGVMPCFHPAEILRCIVSEVLWDLESKGTTTHTAVVTMFQDLQEFQDEYHLQELDTVMEELDAYLHPKMPYEFTVSTESGDQKIEYRVTPEECECIEQAKLENIPLDQVEVLHGLFARLSEMVRMQLEKDKETETDGEEPKFTIRF